MLASWLCRFQHFSPAPPERRSGRFTQTRTSASSATPSPTASLPPVRRTPLSVPKVQTVRRFIRASQWRHFHSPQITSVAGSVLLCFCLCLCLSSGGVEGSEVSLIFIYFKSSALLRLFKSVLKLSEETVHFFPVGVPLAWVSPFPALERCFGLVGRSLFLCLF